MKERRKIISWMFPYPLRNQWNKGSKMMQEIYDISWPATLESIFVSLVGMVDTLMVSGLGTVAISAIGICSQPKFIALAFVVSLNVATTALISRRIGQGHPEEASYCLRQALLCSFFVSLLVCGFSFFFAYPYLVIAGAGSDTIELAVSYFKIAIIAQFFQGLCMTITTAQRCSGNSKISMQANITANLVNIILNYLLIGGHFGFPAMGVQGAAVATLIGAIIGLTMALYSVLNKKSQLQLNPTQSWRLQSDTCRTLTRISAAAFLEQFCLRLGGFIYARLAAGLGTAIFASHQICVNITNILFSFYDGFVATAAALVGKSLGAKKQEEGQWYTQLTCRMSLVLSVFLCVVTVLGAPWIMSWFTQDASIILNGCFILWLSAATLQILPLRMIYAGALRGAGDTRFVAVSTFLSMTIMRPLLAWWFTYPLGWGLMGIWLALACDFVVRFLLTRWRFRSGKWKHIQL